MRKTDDSCYKCGSTYDTDCVRIGMWLCAECRAEERRKVDEWERGRDAEEEVDRQYILRRNLLRRYLGLARRDYLRRAITTTNPIESRRLLRWSDWCARKEEEAR